MTQPSATHHHDHSIVETLQSLIFAFVLAMAFRGFVLEGFVIPTGSMAPTLLGEHSTWVGKKTGYTYQVDSGSPALSTNSEFAKRGAEQYDPMLPVDSGEDLRVQPRDLVKKVRPGDRILIVKGLYPFWQPDRFDVVVFKNPVDPLGDKENFIKRLVGLPGETIWLCDGDVFARKGDGGDLAEEFEGFEIQRKPEHVQRAVWQPVYSSSYIPLAEPSVQRVQPWLADQAHAGDWTIANQRSYRCETADETTIYWNNDYRPIDDRTTYNMFSFSARGEEFPVSDVRAAAGITPDQEGWVTTFILAARGYTFEFIIDSESGQATVRGAADDGSDGFSVTDPITLPGPGEVINVEFWHVDQALWMFIDGRRAAYVEYVMQPRDRLLHATDDDNDQVLRLPNKPSSYLEPSVSWRFSGSPITLHRVRLDRDIYYRPTGRGGSANDPARLTDEQFFMCGDNSPASHDSRGWNDVHPLVAAQIDPDAHVVNRRLLLGKAWLVYFPATLPIQEDGRRIVPDFGRMRFIR